MPRTAKLFRNGRSQAVRLPADFRFEGEEVYICQDPAPGDVILSRRPESWDSFFKLVAEATAGRATRQQYRRKSAQEGDSASQERALL